MVALNIYMENVKYSANFTHFNQNFELKKNVFQ